MSGFQRIMYVAVLGAALAMSLAAQVKPSQCVKPEGKIKYKIIGGRTGSQLFALVSPKDVNPKSMRLLAAKINYDYCAEPRVFVVIFDSRERYQDFLQLDYYFNLRKRFVAERGYYSLDREKGEELLEFSLTPGKPTTEVQIDLTLDKPVNKLN